VNRTVYATLKSNPSVFKQTEDDGRWGLDVWDFEPSPEDLESPEILDDNDDGLGIKR